MRTVATLDGFRFDWPEDVDALMIHPGDHVDTPKGVAMVMEKTVEVGIDEGVTVTVECSSSGKPVWFDPLGL